MSILHNIHTIICKKSSFITEVTVESETARVLALLQKLQAH